MNHILEEDSILENGIRKATASFLDLSRMKHPNGGYDIQEVIDEYKKVNQNHLHAMERIEKIISSNEVTDEDSDYFKELDLSFSKMKLDRKSTILNGEEIIESVLHATLIETYNKSKIFFGNNDVYQWRVKEKEYKTFFIKLGQHVQLMISTVGSLCTYQTDIFKAFDPNYKKYNSFSEVFDFDALLFEAEEIIDLNLRRLLVFNMYVGARKLYLQMTDDGTTESLQTEYENFIKKCEEYLEIIDLQIDNASKSNSMGAPPPLVSSVIPSSTFKLASKKKTDFIKVISAMYDAKLFINENGEAVANKQELKEDFGAVKQVVTTANDKVPVTDNEVEKSSKNPTKLELLTNNLFKYGFFDIPNVKVLSSEKQSQLVELFLSNKLPYCIAMFDFLDFLKFLDQKHFRNIKSRNVEIAKWFNSNERAVRGNVNILNDYTDENDSRYTANKHKEKVEKDYNDIK